MNRHFFNFIAAFNAAAKTKKWTLFFPIRNRFTYVFIEFLDKERLIEGFRLVDGKTGEIFSKDSPKRGRALPLGKKGSPYEVIVRIDLKHDLVSRIYSVTKPGKDTTYNCRQLKHYAAGHAFTGSGGVVICSSARFRGLCTSDQLVTVGEGGLVLCVVFIK